MLKEPYYIYRKVTKILLLGAVEPVSVVVAAIVIPVPIAIPITISALAALPVAEAEATPGSTIT
jgi:hypothetical protein